MKTTFVIIVLGAITLINFKPEKPNLKSELAIQNSEIAIQESNKNIEKLKNLQNEKAIFVSRTQQQNRKR
jgi:hypothetical protein